MHWSKKMLLITHTPSLSLTSHILELPPSPTCPSAAWRYPALLVQRRRNHLHILALSPGPPRRVDWQTISLK